jgi:hypothetical protein
MSTRRSAHLPQKICPVCRRPFSWRKKWARSWDDVVYCSNACRKGRASTTFVPR